MESINPYCVYEEILVGASDGNVYKMRINLLAEFYRREERYLKEVTRRPNAPVTGLWINIVPGGADLRRVILAPPSTFMHFAGKIDCEGEEDCGTVDGVW
jgi:hypothetical protein